MNMNARGAMNLQQQSNTAMSREELPNRGIHGGSLPSQSQPQSRNHPSQLHGINHSMMMDPDSQLAREITRKRISLCLQGSQIPRGWMPKLPEIIRFLDERLFRMSSSKEDYMNKDTLVHRINMILKSMNSRNQRLPPQVSSSAIGTMIPTPGVPHGGSMNLAVSGSADCSMISSPYSGSALGTTTGTNILQTLNGAAVIGQSDPLNSSNGIYPDSHHQSSSIKPMDSGRNIALNISLASSQMIPTPGLNNSQSVVLNSGGNITGGFSGAESTVVSEQRMKQYAVNYNNHPLHNAGGQFGVASRSNIAHSYELLNNVSASMGKSTQPFSGSSISEGQLSDLSLPAYSQQYHHPAMPNAYATNNLPAASESLELKAELNKVPPTYQSNFQPGQQAMLKQSLKGNPENMDFQSSLSVQDDLLQSQHIQSYQQQQFQQQPSQTYMPFDQLQYMQQTPQNCQQQYEADTITSNQSLMNSSFGKQLKAEHGMEFQNEAILSHAPTEVHPGLHGQYIPDNIVTIPRGNNTISQMSTSETFQPSVQSQDAFSSPTAGSQLRVHLQGRYHSQALKEFGTQEKPSFPQNVQNEFQQKIIGQDIAQGPHLTMERSMSGHAACIANIDAVPPSSNLVSCGNGNSLRRKEYLNQRRLLLFLRHARWCSFPKGKCPEVNCIKIQQLLIHMRRCNRKECGYHLCHNAKVIVKHHHDCQNTTCPVCIPVRNYIAAERNRYPTSTGLLHEMNDSCKMLNGDDGKKTLSNTTPSMTNSEYLQSPYKRMKVEQSSSLISKRENSSIAVSEISQLHSSQEAQAQGSHPIDAGLSLNYEHADKRTETSARRGLEDSKATHKTNGSENGPTARLGGNFTNPIHPDYRAKEEPQLIEKGSDRIEVDVEREMSESSGDHVFETKSGKPKIHGVSLIELFTAEQVREHITGLRQWIGQSKAKVEKNQAMERLMSENSCQLCAVERLSFEPPPIYCTRCGARIKRNATYYTSGTSDTRQYVCVPCCNEVRGDIIKIEGSSIPKSKLEKKKNDEDLDEPWVQCGKCEAWQHQVCALFNSRRDDKGQAEYTCPNCYAQEIERGDRQPLPQSAVLGAADLPRTLLSDHLEQRLFKQLMKERQERASHLGKSFDEVPGAEELVIRVVSSVDKKVEVKQHFHDIFQEQNYPTEFPYKSKVILLFQRIEGVEVCLFGMYVQEFGSECQFPNQRRVYLSYLDSVKYFRPEMRTVAGEALRTFVYHEILIGYLEYCKRRGFTSCYIWACPPLKGEDYILYCHPEIQKTPKSDKLRDWYLSMLRKATRENIVVGLTNLYDHFFLKVGECKANVTAARLPYFDGDYWPGAAEDLISEFLQEEERQKKGKTKKTITKRALRAAGHADLSDNASKDALLMQKLGETIYPMKEDFIMVHLQHACTHCCLLMVSGTRWVCSRCKNFQLCGKCYDEERKLEERIRHPVNSKEKHVLNPVEIDDVPLDTNDKDEILESEYFDTRQAFLGLCQGNHYQYDTLRRAKHSSMMVLYHLHNPAAPAFVTSCAVCNNDIDAGQGWRCDVCPDFEVCNHCYQKERGTNHPHKLTNLPSMVNAQNTEARQKSLLQSGALQVRKILDLLVHASQCRLISPQHQCQYPLCIKVKGLFLHSKNCKTRAAGGCKQCKKIWHLLWLHGRACKESKCPVPRCKDMKEHFRNMNEHLRRQQNQSESRRRAAVMEMMRQRNAEVVVNSG